MTTARQGVSQPNNIKLIALTIAMALAIGLAYHARANEPAAASFPCAVLESSSGEAEVLDSSRTHLAEATPNTPVPCGGWVSVSRGVAKLKHRFGYELHLGPGTFAQFNDSEDAILLFRGQLYSVASGGMGELRILTPNARVKVSRAAAITLFDSDEESTQVVALDGTSEIANRFDAAATVLVKAGEQSTLDFKLLRVVPSVPKVIAIASVKDKLQELDVPAHADQKAYAVIRAREKQVFAEQEKASQPTDQYPDEQVGGKTPNRKSRKLASVPSSGAGDSDNSSPTADYWQAKSVGGDVDGLKILKESKHAAAGRHPAKVSVTDESGAAAQAENDKLDQKHKKADAAEKQRLIEELSEIKSD
jgi:hypothetical protein